VTEVFVNENPELEIGMSIVWPPPPAGVEAGVEDAELPPEELPPPQPAASSTAGSSSSARA
jgi:hypothetical protein